MSLRHTWQVWKQDRLLGAVIRNTGYLFSASALGTFLSMVQSVFSTWLLGVEGVGVLGAIIAFTSTLNRLFSFRMGELVVKYLDRFRSEQRPDRAAAVVKAAALTEGGTSLLAWGLLALLAPWAAVTFAKDAAYAPLFLLYGLTIPGNLMTETSIGVLQTGRRFRSQAWINMGQAVLTAAIIVAAYFLHGDLTSMVFAYLLGKFILGMAPMALAWQSMKEMYGAGWWRASFSLLPPLRELAGFAASTNLSATINLVARDSELLWINFFLSPYEGGLYKIALAIINYVTVPITPFISTTYPELSRCVSERNWPALRRLLRRVTAISGTYTAVLTVGMVIFGPLLVWIYGKGPGFLPSYPVLLVLLVGYGVANMFFWNRSLLLSFHRPGFPLYVTLVAALAKVVLSFALVPTGGIMAQAALLSEYLAVSVGVITWQGLRILPKEAGAKEL